MYLIPMKYYSNQNASRKEKLQLTAKVLQIEYIKIIRSKRMLNKKNANRSLNSCYFNNIICARLSYLETEVFK